jgi:hypothetical protein
LKEIFQWKKDMPSQSTLSRFFPKYDYDSSDVIFSDLLIWWFKEMGQNNLTLDIDSTVITRFGNQEEAEKGYNPKRHGRKSHHPIIAFVAKTKMIANAWMKSGLVNTILTPHKWVASKRQGVDLCSFQYKCKSWGRSRRIVVVRKDTEKLPNCGRKTLFSHEDDYLRYCYSAFVITSDLSDELVWMTYKQRAEAENQIKELKYDYGIEGFRFQDIHATEFVFRWAMMAYNLMSYVRNAIAVSKVKHTLPTLKFRCIAIGAYLVSTGRQKKLMLAVSGSKRDYIERLFQKIKKYIPQMEQSTA